MIDAMEQLDRAGKILIRIIWLQGRLVNLILLKKNPGILKFFKKNQRSPRLEKLREKYMEKDFFPIKEDFFKTFPELGKDWNLLLTDLGTKRDAIAHCYISLHKNIFRYKPDKPIKHHKIKSLRRSVDGKKTKKNLYDLNFSDQNYASMINGIIEFDEVLFPQLCRQLQIKYSSIR